MTLLIQTGSVLVLTGSTLLATALGTLLVSDIIALWRGE